MGLDFKRARTRELSHLGRQQDADSKQRINAASGSAAPSSRPSKADLRAQAAAAIAKSLKPIRKLATVLNLHCASCKHQGSVRVPSGEPWPRFRCRKCGARL